MKVQLLSLPARWGRRRNRDRTNLLMLLDTLAATVKHDLPVLAALRGLLRDTSPIRPWILRSSKWSQAIGAIAADLEQGTRLSAALDRRLSHDLAPHFRLALVHAEEQNRLKAVLPIVADALHRETTARIHWQATLAYPAVQFWTVFMIATGLAIFIVPKFERIFDEMLPGMEVPSMRMANALCELVRFIWGQMIWLVPLLVILRIAFGLRRRFRIMAVFTENLLFAFPVLGRQTKRVVLLQFTQAMDVFLAGGAELHEAAAFALKASHSPWLQRLASRFIEDVEKGEYWADAWERMGVGTAFQTWIIRNAAARGNPESGFRLLQEWLAREISSASQRLASWIEPWAVILNAAFVGAIVFGVFGTLTQLTWGMLGLE